MSAHERILRAKLRPGDVVDVDGERARVYRRNANTVTVRREADGVNVSLEWWEVRPVEWQRMYQEWETEQMVKFISRKLKKRRAG